MPDHLAGAPALTPRTATILALAALSAPSAARAQVPCSEYQRVARENRARKQGVASNDGALEAAAQSADAAYRACVQRERMNASRPAGTRPSGYGPGATAPSELVNSLMGILNALEDTNERRQRAELERAEAESRQLAEEERRRELEAEQRRLREAEFQRDLESSFADVGCPGCAGPARESSPATGAATAGDACADPVLKLANPALCERQAEARAGGTPAPAGTR
jgi:hypothetical protein